MVFAADELVCSSDCRRSRSLSWLPSTAVQSAASSASGLWGSTEEWFGRPAAAWEEGPISYLCRPLDSAKRRFCPRGGAKAVKSVAVMKVRMLLRNRSEAKLLFSANTFSTSLPVTTVTRGQNSDASPFEPTCAMCVFVGPGHASDATDSMASWNERRADGRTDGREGAALGAACLSVRPPMPHHKL